MEKYIIQTAILKESDKINFKTNKKRIKVINTQFKNDTGTLQYSLSILDNKSRKKNQKIIKGLNKSIGQLDLIDIYTTLKIYTLIHSTI